MGGRVIGYAEPREASVHPGDDADRGFLGADSDLPVGILGSRIARDAVTFGGYLLLSLMLFARPLFGHWSSFYVGHDTHDPTLFMWCLRWWPYALRHRLNPFVTNTIWAPAGFNLTWTTGVPLAALIFAPITTWIGPVAAYNLMMIASPALAAAAAYLLCREFTRNGWPAIFGGYVFGFSSYLLGQMHAHVHLALVFPIPLSALLIVRFCKGNVGAARFTILFALTTIAEFLISVEVCALSAAVSALALMLAWCTGDKALRRSARALIVPLATSWIVTVAAVSPYLYYMLQGAKPQWPIWPIPKFSIDLLNFFIPTGATLLGANSWLGAISSRFAATAVESGGYIALPLIAIVVAWARRNWSGAACRVAIALIACLAIASLGPFLQIAGRLTVPMPWLAAQFIPIFEQALPARLLLFIFLLIAIIAATWLETWPASRGSKTTVVALSIALTLPNLSGSYWLTRADSPRLFTTDEFKSYIAPGDVVLALPWGDQGTSMMWQAQCRMCFRNVGGWTGLSRFDVRRWPIVNYFIGDENLAEPELQLKAFLAASGVKEIVVDDAAARADHWNRLIQSSGLTPIRTGGVSLYRVPPLWATDYGGKTGLEMERRADQARFDTMLAAVVRYAAEGWDPRQVSRQRLIGLGLLPASWTLQPVHADAYIVPDRDAITISELGSRDGLDGIIRRYASAATCVLYPDPHVLLSRKPLGLMTRAIHGMLRPIGDGSDGPGQHFLAMTFALEDLRAMAVSEPGDPPAVARR